jgi:hypothetical protein
MTDDTNNDLKKVVYYDVLSKTSDGFESRFFTVNDFIRILKNSFIDYEEFKHIARDKVSPSNSDYIINNIMSYHDRELFPPQIANALRPVIDNEEKLPYSNTFTWKVLNFQRNTKRMFNFYVNKRTPLFFGSRTETSMVHNNPNVPEGMIIIRVLNYKLKEDVPTEDFVDVSTRMHVDTGIVDSQLRSIPWFLDEFINYDRLNLKDNEYYVMSPLLHHCLKIYDKILLLSKQKNAYVYPMLLKNAIDASFNDARIVAGMNEKYKFINNTFIRIVPALIEYDQKTKKEKRTSRFFNVLQQQDAKKAYSYSDVVTGGSGDLGTNKITIRNYKDAVDNMNANSIIFTKEENTLNGLFAWILPEFAEVIADQLMHNKKDTVVDNRHLSNHMIRIDYVNNKYITAINGASKGGMINVRKAMAIVKKINNRIKVSNSRTFLFDDQDEFTHNMINKQVGNKIFRRDFNYLSGGKDIQRTDYSRNALVAFVSNDIDIPDKKTIMGMTIDQYNQWLFTLRGIGCEGFFSKDFLSQHQKVPRTKHIKCNMDDTSEDFQEIVRNYKNYANIVFSRKENKDQFLVRQYMECTCGGKIVKEKCQDCSNPTPLTGELLPEYWVDFSKGFSTVELFHVSINEDTISMYVIYSIPLDNVRFKCEELSKNVAVQTAQVDLGYLNELRLGDVTISGINVPLDGVYFGLGGFKSKTNGIGFAALRLYNAMKGEVVYDSDDCLDHTEDVNKLLSTFKKSLITTKMYNPESGLYETKEIEAWVGMLTLSPTEVSQEFNKSRLAEERSFTKANYALYGLLGFQELNKAFAIESGLVNSRTNSMRKELFKIADIHSSTRPSMPGEDREANALASKFDNLLQGSVDLTYEYRGKNRAFNLHGVGTYSIKGLLTKLEYQDLISKYPLFNNNLFSNAWHIKCYLRIPKEIATHYNRFGALEHAIYFPNKEILMNMFEFIGDNTVRMSEVLSAYLGVFETLCVSKISATAEAGNSLINRNYNKQVPVQFNSVNGSLLDAVNNELFYKEGIINQISNIAVPRIMSKQLTCIHCPVDVTVVTNRREYKRIVYKYLKNRFPDKKPEDFDWSEPEQQEDGSWSKAGWCWYEPVHCAADREPVIMAKQNINILQMWSIHKANDEYRTRYGRSFSQMHPGTRGIYLNPSFIVANQEADIDGDNIYLMVMISVLGQDEMLNVFNTIKNNAFFDSANENPIAKAIRETYLPPTIDYLIDEASNLNFDLDQLVIGYTDTSFSDSFNANIEASDNKANIGFLTVSLWYVTYFIDFYIYNYDRLSKRYDNIPEFTDKNRYDLLFIFQYLLAQQNGVRAMKDDGVYGKLTFEALVTNQEFKDSGNARELFNLLIKDYTDNNSKVGINIDFKESVTKFFNVLDNMVINKGRGSKDMYKGFGFIKNYKNEVFHFTDKRWGYDSSKGANYVDCTDMYDPMWLDFQGLFLLVNGRRPDVFITKFGYDKLLQSIDFERKLHLHNPLFVYAKDLFIK